MRIIDLDAWLVRRQWRNCPHCAVGTLAWVWGLLCLLFGWFASASPLHPLGFQVAAVGMAGAGSILVFLGALVFLADSHDLGKCTP